jgi:hypothetical protein
MGSGTLSGCGGLESIFEPMLQSALSSIWTKPAIKQKVETKAEAKLLPALKGALNGLTLSDNWFGDIYIENVEWVDVNIGTQAPTIDVTAVTFSQTSTNYFMNIGWKLLWAAGNKAKISFELEIDAWFGFPDHTVKIHSVEASAKGNTLVKIPKSLTQKGAVNLSVESSWIDLKADAEGWFWTVNISAEVKALVKDKFLPLILDQTFGITFGPIL